MGKNIDALPFEVVDLKPYGTDRRTAHDKEGTGVHPLDYYADHLWKALKAADNVTGQTSDGHHTFDELYEYRMLCNAHAAHGWLSAGIDVVKSWRHSDGEECFGGGWFIVTAELPTGQVSNHYKAEYWDLFQVPDEPLAPEYDGHTPAVAAQRLRGMLMEEGL